MRFLFFLLTLTSLTGFGQDTIMVEPSIVNQKNINIRSPKTALEIIYFNASKMYFEECYYVDGVRRCSSNKYQIKQDSVIVNEQEIWVCKKISNNNYQVKRTFQAYTITGTASSIMPFYKEGTFYATSNKGDTLWQEEFKMNNFKRFQIYQNGYAGKVYALNEVDFPPHFKDYWSLFNVTQQPENVDLSPNNEFRRIRLDSFVTFVIDEKCSIRNIQFPASFSTSLIKDVLIHLSTVEVLKPAINESENVNVLFKFEPQFFD